MIVFGVRYGIDAAIGYFLRWFLDTVGDESGCLHFYEPCLGIHHIYFKRFFGVVVCLTTVICP